VEDNPVSVRLNIPTQYNPAHETLVMVLSLTLTHHQPIIIIQLHQNKYVYCYYVHVFHKSFTPSRLLCHCQCFWMSVSLFLFAHLQI